MNLMAAIPKGANNACYGGLIARKMGLSYVQFLWLCGKAREAGLLVFVTDCNKFFIPVSLEDIQRKIDEVRAGLFGWQEFIDELEMQKAYALECVKDEMAEINELKRMKGESV